MDDHRMRVIGLMSGTSLDGVDAAIIETDGEQIFALGKSVTVPFSADTDFKAVMEAAIEWQFIGPQPNIFSKAEKDIHAAHIEAVKALGAARVNIDLIGFHGQTVLHRPAVGGRNGETLQLGDGAVLARQFGVPCAYDFRSDDVAAGGQGAPLAPIYHKALCDYSGLTGRIAVVNIGGVSNVTLIDADAPLIATDCGPGNGPLDSLVQKNTGRSYDKDGALSIAGIPNFDIIDQWLKRDFFMRQVPRSADRYDFDVLADLNGVPAEDACATLCSFTAQAIARDLKTFNPQTIIVCGGGRLNQAIMGMLAVHCTGGAVVSAEAVGWDGDALEAQAFAYLAVRTLRGLPISFPGTTGASKPMKGGKIARIL